MTTGTMATSGRRQEIALRPLLMDTQFWLRSVDQTAGVAMIAVAAADSSQ